MWVLPRTPCSSPCKTAPSPRIVKLPHRLPCPWIDKPEPPLLSPVAGEPQDSAVSLTWTPGAANGSPITNYKVSWTGAVTGEKDCGAVTSCQVTGLKNGKTYSFTVAARNDVGWSKPSTAVEATPDKVPVRSHRCYGHGWQ